MSFNATMPATVMQMSASGWDVPTSRIRTLESLPTFVAGGGSGVHDSSSSSSSPHSSLQHIPAYNYFDSASQQHRLYLPQSHYQHKSGSGGSSGNSKKRPSGADVRQYRHKMLERAAYTNRSFMHQNEYDQRGFVFESSHYGLDYDAEERPRKHDRRRHSMHHIANKDKMTVAAAPVTKTDDLKHRFDEYSSSAAVGSRRPSRPSPSQFVVGGAISGGARLGYGGARPAGSKSLEVYESQWVSMAAAAAAEGTRRQKGVPANAGSGNGKIPKRGSRSSQGSTDSSHSSHSASSGSLLLTVANLENFAKIHKKHESSYGTSRAMEEYLSSTVGVVPTAAILDAVGASKYSSNIVLKANPAEPASSSTAAIISIEEITSDSSQQQQDQQLPIGLGRLPMKTKDPDSVSMASSTHFTMINGVGGPQRLPKGGLCSRGHQITVLIVTMSIVFMVGICAAVFFLEMRAREMPR